MSAEGALRILLVDDEAGIRQGLGDLLRAHGHHVDTADSVDRALDVLRRHRVDLLITDLKMEGGDGLDLVRTAREIDPDLAAMVVTGYASLEVALEAVRLGLVDLIEKPFRARRVLEAVAGIRRRRTTEVAEDGTFAIPLDRGAPSELAGQVGVLLAARGFRNPARAEVQTAVAQTARTLLAAAEEGTVLRAIVEAAPGEARVVLEGPAVTFLPGEDARRLLDLLLDETEVESGEDATRVRLSRSASRRDPDVCIVRPEDAEGDLSDLRVRVASSAPALPVELDLSECEALSAEALRNLDDLVAQTRGAGRDVEVVHAPVPVRRAAAALGLVAIAGPAARPENLIRNTLWS
jgi:DNA-binding response OmpR family regulator